MAEVKEPLAAGGNAARGPADGSPDGRGHDENNQVQDAAVKTYRYLRGGLVAIVVLLAVAIIKSAIDNRCFQTSLSAYYYTPVRPIFVGMLMMLGLGLIVLRGLNIWEDIALNFAGVFALGVAVMPTTDVGSCAVVTPNVNPVDHGTLAPWVVANVDNNLWALIFTGFIGVVATGVIGAIDRRSGRSGRGHVGGHRPGVGLGLFTVVLLVVMVWYWADPESLRGVAHGWSALLMFAILAGIALYNSRKAFRENSYRTIYRVIGIAMVVFGVASKLFLQSAHHQILILETGEILLFAVYWAVQTIENWVSPNPRVPGRGGQSAPAHLAA